MLRFNSIFKGVNLLLIIGMMIVAACSVLALRQIKIITDSNTWIVHTHDVIDAANVTLLLFNEADARLNIYKVTKDKKLIQFVPRLLNLAKQKIDILKNLTKDNVIQTARINEIENLLNTELLQTQKILNSHDPDVLSTITSDAQRLSQVISELIHEESNLLYLRNQSVDRETDISNLVLMIFFFISEALLILSLILIVRKSNQRDIAEKKRAQAEQNLRLKNAELQLSEERYFLATEGIEAGLWDWEIGTQKIYYSPYYKKMLGYTNENFPDSLQSFEKIIHPQDHDRVWELINKNMPTSKPFKFEYRLQNQSGKYKWYQGAGLSKLDDDGKPIRMLGSIIDIEERKRAEQSLTIQYWAGEVISEADKLEIISQKIIKILCIELRWQLGAFWIIDEKKHVLVCKQIWHQYSDRLKVFANETLKLKLSYGTGLPGRIWQSGEPLWITDVVKDKNYPRAAIAEKSGLHSAFGFPIKVQNKIMGIIECYSTEIEKSDQYILDLMKIIGNQIGLVFTRRQMENNLRESEQYKTAILKASADSILTIDGKGNITSLNQQTKKEFGYYSEELIHQNINIILPHFSMSNQVLDQKTYIETDAKRKNGESFPVELTITKMDSKEEHLQLYVLNIRNITERKKVEKMKNEFVSVVSHELRTPLTSIRGALGLILGGATGAVSEKTEKLLHLANDNSMRLLLLINDILDVEKLEAGKLKFDYKIVKLDELIRQSISINKIYADKFNVKLIVKEPIPSIELNVDPDRLMQVFTNLISNAVKFSPKGEAVTIDIKEAEDKVRVLISNKGPGIPVEFQPKLFKKFSQADSSVTRSVGGTGLGLYISKTIIEKLGGVIDFISKPNEVTTFYFELPIYEKYQTLKSVNEPIKHSDVKLLICEDDETQAACLSELLASAGYKTDIAHNVKEAKKYLQQNQYQALLLDLILPDQDGISFIRELRSHKNTHHLPIIVISVIAKTGKTLLDGDAINVIDWLEKPMDFEKVLQDLQNLQNKTYPKTPNVLHVEDDQVAADYVKSLLETDMHVTSCQTIQQTKKILKNNSFDLIILDLLLPDGNAEELIPLIAEYKIPVIVYSAVELDHKLAKNVRFSLRKSATSKEKLLSLIKEVLDKNHTQSISMNQSKHKLKKILYAEDELSIQEIGKMSLEDIGGFEVCYCMNGNEVLKKITSFNPDLVLLDVMMPVMGGIETMQAIRHMTQFKNIPIILLTAKSQQHEIDEYKKMGANDIIIKPFDPMLLATDLRMFWDKYCE